MKSKKVLCFALILMSILALSACNGSTLPEQIQGDWYLEQDHRKYADCIPALEPHIISFASGPDAEYNHKTGEMEWIEKRVIFSFTPTTLTLIPAKYDNRKNTTFTNLKYKDDMIVSDSFEFSYSLDTSITPNELTLTGKDEAGNSVSFTLYNRAQHDKMMADILEEDLSDE